MGKKISFFLLIIHCMLPLSAHAILSLELTQGVAGAIPIAIVPFGVDAGTPPSQDVSTIIGNDLQNSGRFKTYGRSELSQFPTKLKEVIPDYFRRLGTGNVVIGFLKKRSDGQYLVSFQLLDMFTTKKEVVPVLSKEFTVKDKDLRTIAHHISDLIYKQITGMRGIFSTKLAYIVIERNKDKTRYILEVSDQDGYNPRPLLNSSEPIMSPAWSPNARQLAYVSFENRQAGVFVQEVATGQRRLVSNFPGINGAPAWSPDGSKLALVLSKNGAPNIYVMDIASSNLKQLTNDFYINTEPSWSPDGKSLLFTSNRSGGPQIYELQLKTGTVKRVSYDGDYNARAAFTRDGNAIAMIHRVDGIFKIALLNLDTGRMQVLTPLSGDSASPSVAPNGSMLLYDTFIGNKNVLGMVSSDAKVHLLLPSRSGDAQDPAWSPFIS